MQEAREHLGVLSQRGSIPSLSQLRVYRQQLFKLNDSEISARVTQSQDFYSAGEQTTEMCPIPTEMCSQGGCLDLLFNPCEHCFTLTELSECIAANILGLKVVQARFWKHWD